MFSGVPPATDIDRRGWQVSCVPRDGVIGWQLVDS
jgi:hypothetical protein